MSSGYRALLQSLDETEKDVMRGLGRSVQIRKPRTGCCRCCCSNGAMWTCIALVILSGLIISIGLPILLTVPVESSWHWKHWIPRYWTQEITANSSLSTNEDQHLLAVGYYYIAQCQVARVKCVTHFLVFLSLPPPFFGGGDGNSIPRRKRTTEPSGRIFQHRKRSKSIIRRMLLQSHSSKTLLITSTR